MAFWHKNTGNTAKKPFDILFHETSNKQENYVCMVWKHLTQYVECKSNEHQKDMRNTITALK